MSFLNRDCSFVTCKHTKIEVSNDVLLNINLPQSKSLVLPNERSRRILCNDKAEVKFFREQSNISDLPYDDIRVPYPHKQFYLVKCGK